MKNQTTLYLDSELVKQAKLLGINLSETAERAIASMIASAPFKDEEAYLDYLIERRAKLLEKQRVLKEQFEDVTERLKNVEVRIEQQKRIVHEIHLSRRIASLIGQLNEVILSYRYDYDVIKKEAEGLLRELNNLRKDYFSESWLKEQIERVREAYGE